MASPSLMLGREINAICFSDGPFGFVRHSSIMLATSPPASLIVRSRIELSYFLGFSSFGFLRRHSSIMFATSPVQPV